MKTNQSLVPVISPSPVRVTKAHRGILSYLEVSPALVTSDMVPGHVVKPGMESVLPGLPEFELLHLGTRKRGT